MAKKARKKKAKAKSKSGNGARSVSELQAELREREQSVMDACNAEIETLFEGSGVAMVVQMSVVGEAVNHSVILTGAGQETLEPIDQKLKAILKKHGCRLLVEPAKPAIQFEG